MPSSPLWKLRRLVDRSKRVQTRRAAESPVIAAYGATLVAKADAYARAYDAASRSEAAWRKELVEGRGAVAALARSMAGWLPLCQRDIPDFDASSYSTQVDVPDDLLQDGARLLGAIDTHRDAQGQPLTYREAAMSELTQQLASAEKEWAEAEAADSQYQQLLKKAREAGEVFDAELQAFRRSLQSAFGRHDKDFQRLRAERASQRDEDDEDDDEAAPPTETQPPQTQPPQVVSPQAAAAQTQSPQVVPPQATSS